MKTCTRCGDPKDDNEFSLRSKGSTKRRNICKACISSNYFANRDVIRLQRKTYDDEHRDILRARGRTEKRRAQNRAHAKRSQAVANKRQRERKKTDIAYRLRRNLSSKIARAMRKNGGGKQMSFLKCVQYSMMELKTHLEKQFEVWMTWSNYGPYVISTWNDQDSTTWTWNIDHIIPQSELPYTSMEDENFQKCWGLDNLQPLSAKQNLLKGTA